MPKFYSQLEEASLENLSSDPAAGTAGRVFRNSTENRVKVDDGTNIRALLRNDGNCAIGNSGTANNNVRLHRGGNGLLQFVAGGDATSEGSSSTNLAQISAEIENATSGARPANGNAGRAIWVTDTQRLQIDDGSAWRTIGPNPSTTKGDLIVHNGTVDARLAVGTDGFFLKANSSTATGLEWASGSANLSVRSMTSTGNILTSDDFVLFSGASFTATLPTAVGNAGKVFRFQHNGTSGSQVYSIATTSGQTVGLYTSGQYQFQQRGEWAVFVSDGANYQILDQSPKITVLSDVKANNTSGGGFTNGAYRTRTLNTQTGDTSFCTLSSNQFTLIPGRYAIFATAPAAIVDQHKAKIRNITDSTDALIGQGVRANSASAMGNTVQIDGVIEISASKTFELQHRCGTSNGTDGFGVASNFGENEVYSIVRIQKLY